MHDLGQFSFAPITCLHLNAVHSILTQSHDLFIFVPSGFMRSNRTVESLNVKGGPGVGSYVVYYSCVGVGVRGVGYGVG